MGHALCLAVPGTPVADTNPGRTFFLLGNIPLSLTNVITGLVVTAASSTNVTVTAVLLRVIVFKPVPLPA